MSPMTLQMRLDALLDAAKSVGIPVEKVPMGGEGGGLAILAGKRRLFVDTMSDTATAYETTLGALAAIPEIDALPLPESVRADLDKLREST